MRRSSKRAALASASWRFSLSSNPAIGRATFVDLATSENTASKFQFVSGGAGALYLRCGRPRAAARLLETRCLRLVSSTCSAWTDSKSSSRCSNSRSVADMTFIASVAAAMRTDQACSRWAARARRIMFSASGENSINGCLIRGQQPNLAPQSYARSYLPYVSRNITSKSLNATSWIGTGSSAELPSDCEVLDSAGNDSMSLIKPQDCESIAR